MPAAPVPAQPGCAQQRGVVRSCACHDRRSRADRSRMRRADALPTLLDERDHGLLTSVLSFLQALVVADSARCVSACGFSSCRDGLTCGRVNSFRGCLAKVVRLLDRLVRTQDVPPDYLYYSLPSPWMQARRWPPVCAAQRIALLTRRLCGADQVHAHPAAVPSGRRSQPRWSRLGCAAAHYRGACATVRDLSAAACPTLV